MKRKVMISYTVEEGNDSVACVKIKASNEELIVGLGVIFNVAIDKIAKSTGATRKKTKEEILKFISKKEIKNE